jgi:hypothetical protein
MFCGLEPRWKLQLPLGFLFWYTINMAKYQKKRGRPATGRDPAVTIRISQGVLDAVETWAAGQDDTPARSPAIVRLVEIGLKSPMNPKKKRPDNTMRDSDGRVIPAKP